MSKGVVSKYVGLTAAAELDCPAIAELDEAALERLLKASAVTPSRPSDFVLPDYGRVHQELRRKGMTLMLPYVR